nr:hypothetical protein CFP56_53057 [Quercus suber]
MSTARPKYRVLSREEETEISRSKKKVKEVHHADFNNGASEGGHSQGHQKVWGSSKTSFKEKLVGEIPGAFAKAFDFTDFMEDEAESDDEVLELREGLAAVKLSKETKLRIRGPWANTLIIKLFGKAVGFSFLQSKLNFLWKPSERIDLVDLGYDFYSVRPWEPYFKPKTANVTSIAVWVRLHALTMELYETEIDINKPLINTVLIGRFEQPVTYEGIQKLCFPCGRIGHKKDVCPYTIRKPNPPAKGADGEHENQRVSSHVAHVMDSTISGQRVSRSATEMEGPTGSVKKSLRYEVGQGTSYNSSKTGWVKAPNTLLRADAEPNGKFVQDGPDFVGHIANQNFVAGTNKIEFNTRTSPSVRGKKGIARNRL